MPKPASAAAHLAPYKWQPGQSPNPAGRPRGARSKLSESVIAKLLADFEAHGDSVIARVRTHQPAAYLAACVSLLPKQQEKIESPFADLSDEELELLEHFLKSTRAKQITTIDAEVVVQDARERADASPPTQSRAELQTLSRAEKAQRQHARAATVKVSPQSLSDAEIDARLDNALNSKDR